MGISNHSIRFSASLAALFLFVGGIGSVHAETEVAATAGPDRARLAKSVDHAVEFLGKSQAEDGSYSSQAGPGITAIVATSLVRSGGSADDPVVAKALKYLDGFVHDDGGIYAPGSRYQNYETSLAILAYHAANSDGRYDERLKKAEAFVKKIQWDGEEGHGEESMSYGGAGYGSHSRPDLSNTSFLIEALHTVGAEENDEALQKALVFVSRCQNLESPYNTTEFAAKIDDGGFYYTIAAGGSSQAGSTPDGGLRSYGSMTYAGLKSMIYCGVGPDDPRVKAATKWIKDHYTLAENPGMGADGLYYYFHTFAKALDAVGEDQFVAADGTSHDWRRELAEHLFKLQKDDGSWTNSSERWLESDPNLVTAYSLLALNYCGQN
ncbi:MAG: prenyltransferase/squalene oxidase repeat-containing protein [Pirellulales bacterium]